MPELVLATSNPGKVRELREILGDLPWVVRSLEGLPPVDFPPEGDDYEANALAKAQTAARALGCAALADDSGLEVDALGGRPGVRSARYGGPDLDDAGRVARLLDEMAGVETAGRGARFVCVAAFATPDGAVAVAHGSCPGRILEAVRGRGGFGYDPVFLLEGDERTLAELPAEEKNRVSHRAHAVRALRPSILAWGAS